MSIQMRDAMASRIFSGERGIFKVHGPLTWACDLLKPTGNLQVQGDTIRPLKSPWVVLKHVWLKRRTSSGRGSSVISESSESQMLYQPLNGGEFPNTVASAVD